MSTCTCGYGDRAAIAQRLAEREAIESALKRAEAERDALRAEVEGLRADMAGRQIVFRRLLRAAQSNHRAWKRMQSDRDDARGAVRHLRADCEVMIKDQAGIFAAWHANVRGLASQRDRITAAAKSLHRAWKRERAFVDALRADGLDIDDPATAPVWTGKIHDKDGRLLFDLATARAEPEPPSTDEVLGKLRAVVKERP